MPGDRQMSLHLLLGPDKRFGIRHLGVPTELAGADFEPLVGELFSMTLGLRHLFRLYPVIHLISDIDADMNVIISRLHPHVVGPGDVVRGSLFLRIGLGALLLRPVDGYGAHVGDAE